MPKKILLARPNGFMVNHMLTFIESVGCKPICLDDISDINNHDSDQLAAIVISTSVTSTVSQSFKEVLCYVAHNLPTVPIFLATLADIEVVKKCGSLVLNDSDILREFKSIDELSLNPRNKNEILIIKKENIVNEIQLKIAIDVVRKKLR